MLLYSNGCSMTLGDELIHPRADCYPALVAAHCGFDLHNDAYSGASNCRILRTTLLWLAEYLGKGGDPRQVFMIIGWTAPDRREFGQSEEEGTPDASLFWRDIFVHCNLDRGSRDLLRLHELVFGSFSCARESMSRLLVAVTSLSGVLASRGVRFCFHHAMPVMPAHEELASLAGNVDISRFYRFLNPETDFLTTCKQSWKVPMGANNHPLEEGHRRWSGELISFIEKGRLI